MYSAEAEKRFQEHLEELSKLSPSEKRRYLERIDMRERYIRDEDPLCQGDILVRQGITGVSRPDLLI